MLIDTWKLVDDALGIVVVAGTSHEGWKGVMPISVNLGLDERESAALLRSGYLVEGETPRCIPSPSVSMSVNPYT